MTANAFAFIAVTQVVELRPSKKTGRDYLSLTVENEVIDSEPIAVAVWSESLIAEIVDKVKPGTELYIEGTSKLRRWDDRDGVEHVRLQVSAKRVEVLFAVDARPKPRAARAKPAEKIEGGLQEALAIARSESAPAYIGPAATGGGRKYDQPFNDPLPF